LLILLFAIPLSLPAQTISENKKDEFTGQHIKRTTYERFTSASKQRLWGNARISQIDSLIYLEIKLQLGGNIFGVSKGGKVMFKLKNGTILEVTSLSDELSTIGGGAVDMLGSKNPGLHMQCLLTDTAITLLKSSVPTKMRVYTTDGYAEADIKESFGEKISKMVTLIKE